jgi:glycosyltransferase involved in cell wall biosynthesis
VRISIIVPAFNEERLLPSTLEAIRAARTVFDQARWESELIVCDNNSHDRTAEVARAAGAEVVFEPVNQIARARNCGAAAAKGEWLLFIDADSQPSRELFQEVIQTIASGNCLAGGCTMILDTNSLLSRLVVGFWNLLSRCFRLQAGSFIFVEARAFREVAGFSKELFAAEELDLSKKLKALAAKEGKKMIILHRHPLMTSGRKIHLYTKKEHARFVLRSVFRYKQILRSREACHTWYDGRR